MKLLTVDKYINDIAEKVKEGNLYPYYHNVFELYLTSLPRIIENYKANGFVIKGIEKSSKSESVYIVVRKYFTNLKIRVSGHWLSSESDSYNMNVIADYNVLDKDFDTNKTYMHVWHDTVRLKMYNS